jgi:GDPmannose 4,6-dehydratase
MMVKADVQRWQKWQRGEVFPWDAPQYADEANILTRVLRV